MDPIKRQPVKLDNNDESVEDLLSTEAETEDGDAQVEGQ